MNLEVKELEIVLLPFLFHVFEQNRDVLHGNYISLEEWQIWLREKADPYEIHFIIMADDVPAAWLKLNGLNKPTICISMLVVDDAYKRKGVGRFALLYAEKYAKEHAKSAILIQTTQDNVIAKECYLKCGYEIIREIIYKAGDGIDREGYEFQKLIEIDQKPQDYFIRRINPEEYGIIRNLDRDAFEYNERGSDGYWHEVFGDNIRCSPHYIPELELVAVTNDDTVYLGHAIFSTLPMGDNSEHIVWLNSLAVKHSDKDNHIEKSYEYQRKGIGTALVMRGLEIAKSLGYTGCMTCGHPDVYRKKMGFTDYRDFGIAKDDSVDEPDGAIHAIELVSKGFDMTNKLLSFSYYNFTKNETLIQVLNKMLGTGVINTDYKSKRLYGGTVGEVRLVTGVAVTDDGEKLPYNVVLKIQRKWERYGDPDSWRREYDLYTSDFGTLFTDSLRWPECYYTEMNEEENEWQIWMEHIDSISGQDLTVDMFEHAAFELGRWQGKLYADKSKILQNIHNLSKAGDLKDYYLHYRSWDKVYNYIRSDNCEIPKHLCQMLIEIDDNADEIWESIETLPVVLCHRDFWITNIFYKDGEIVLIDWDTTGWGYIGEDIKSLVADEADVNHMVEYYQRCVPAYYKGFSEYANVSHIKNHYIREMILVNLGYRLVEWSINAKSPEEKALQIDTLQKIYEMRDE